jgi:hypothetical protein
VTSAVEVGAGSGRLKSLSESLPDLRAKRLPLRCPFVATAAE